MYMINGVMWICICLLCYKHKNLDNICDAEMVVNWQIVGIGVGIFLAKIRNDYS